MRISGPDMLLDPPGGSHIALVYSRPEERDALVADYINEGLRKGELCVYASVLVRDAQYVENAIAPRIEDYDKKVKDGSLLVVDLAPSYLYAMMGDVKPLDDMKRLFAQRIQLSKSKFFRFAGDAAGALFENGEFDPCTQIEQWWERNLGEGVCFCPYPKTSLQSRYQNIQFYRAVRSTHHFIVYPSREIAYGSNVPERLVRPGHENHHNYDLSHHHAGAPKEGTT